MSMANAKRAATAPEPQPPKTITTGRGWRLYTTPTQADQHLQEHTHMEQNQSNKDADMASGSKDSPNLTWQGADLPRVSPGDYQAVCVGWQGPQWIRAFRRWSIRLEFSLLEDGTLVSAFFNLGSDLEEPHIGRRTRYYMVWCLANGEAPHKGQQMLPSTFIEAGLMYLVRVADCLKDGKEEDKPDALVYSRVTEVLKVDRP
jgi:hypothetical protein